MTEFLWQGIVLFGETTGILGWLEEIKAYGMWIGLLAGVACSFFGFWIYRAVFSALLFGVTAVASCILLNGRVDWGQIVTCFTVVGIFLAALGLYWQRLGGSVICALMLGAAVYRCGWLWAVAAACIGMAFELTFPVIAISFCMSAGGAVLLAECLQGTQYGEYAAAIGIIAGMAGFLVQMIGSRNQKLFPKPYPDRLRWWMENKKGGKHADGIS